MNSQDPFDRAFSYIEEARTTLPVLLDPTGSFYFGYPRPPAYGPYPLIVLIDKEGEIRQILTQYEPTTLRDAIEELRSE